ncbi:hypothetical protein [Oceanicola sp. 502str15]|uniref:hypothetical protein n=1 Tax=Oceanicola sp. 502str15 TaxID=2696061 RepID=UPI002095749D|nr:hypothetical protein [Oceanicola sp. 502str15]MCO6381977.1 hypothetical protein [Oceanicola sp. 502str15]
MNRKNPPDRPAETGITAANPPVSQQTIAQVLECYARGYSSQQAADSAGVDLATVNRILGDAIDAQDSSD